MSILDCISFSFVIVLLLISGIYKSQKIRSESAYLFAERRTKWAALTATLVMTEFNSATLISFSSLGYGVGFWALILPFIFLFGLLFYAFSVAEKWKAFDGMSVAGFFKERYGKDIGSFASILLLVSMLGFSAAYMKSLLLIFQPLVPSLSPWALSGTMVALILAFSLRGGLIAIIRTDVLSFILILLFFPLLCFYLGTSSNLQPIQITQVDNAQSILPLKFVFSLIVLTMFTYILAPWYGQKIFSAASKKTAFWSVISASVLVFILYGSAILACAFFKFRGYECSSWEMALPSLIEKCLPSGVKGLGYALLFATSATTLTGVWSAMCATWFGDFGKTSTDYRRSFFATLAFAGISFVLANTLVDKVFDKLILANIPVAALSFGLLAGFYWNRASKMGVYLSIFVGCFCGIGSYVLYGDAGTYTWYWAVFGIPLTFAAGIAGSLFLREKKPIFPKSA